MSVLQRLPFLSQATRTGLKTVSRDAVLSAVRQSGGSKTLKPKGDRTHIGAATGTCGCLTLGSSGGEGVWREGAGRVAVQRVGEDRGVQDREAGERSEPGGRVVWGFGLIFPGYGSIPALKWECFLCIIAP